MSKGWAAGACLHPERLAAYREMRAAGMNQKDIAAQLGISAPALIQFVRRWSAVEAPAGPRTAPRRCLRCRVEFSSHGPGNRICGACATTDVYAVEHSVARHV